TLTRHQYGWNFPCKQCLNYFFFSSRRRHTRSYGDWSSDVCSSDLSMIETWLLRLSIIDLYARVASSWPCICCLSDCRSALRLPRSEERRVGRECIAGGRYC